MMKTVLIPEDNMLHLSIPDNYVGKEIEVLLYAKEELIEEKAAAGRNAARFKGLLSNEEADRYHAYLRQTRNEWNRDI